jgi:hypothetical protein
MKTIGCVNAECPGIAFGVAGGTCSRLEDVVNHSGLHGATKRQLRYFDRTERGTVLRVADSVALS